MWLKLIQRGFGVTVSRKHGPQDNHSASLVQKHYRFVNYLKDQHLLLHNQFLSRQTWDFQSRHQLQPCGRPMCLTCVPPMERKL